MRNFSKKLKCSLFALLLAPTSIAAQEQSEELSFKSGTWAYQYYAEDQPISYTAFKERLASRNKDLASMFHSGRSLSIVGNVIGGIGAFWFGYDIGARFVGAKGNTALLIGSGAVMSAGIAMSYVGEGRMKKVLTLYKHKDSVASLIVIPGYPKFGICFNF
jgi:hypothetical protein